MKFWLDFRLKVRKFFREHKRVIIIIVIIWGLIIAINYFLKGKQEPVKPITTYDPHSPVMDETDKVPDEYKEPINNLIDNYVNYCNNKEYENAYNLLSNEFKSKYCNTLDGFKSYVDEISLKNDIIPVNKLDNCPNNNGPAIIIIEAKSPRTTKTTINILNHLGSPLSLKNLTHGFSAYAIINAKKNGAIMVIIFASIPIHNPLV